MARDSFPCVSSVASPTHHAVNNSTAMMSTDNIVGGGVKGCNSNGGNDAVADNAAQAAAAAAMTQLPTMAAVEQQQRRRSDDDREAAAAATMLQHQQQQYLQQFYGRQQSGDGAQPATQQQQQQQHYYFPTYMHPALHPNTSNEVSTSDDQKAAAAAAMAAFYQQQYAAVAQQQQQQQQHLQLKRQVGGAEEVAEAQQSQQQQQQKQQSGDGKGDNIQWKLSQQLQLQQQQQQQQQQQSAFAEQQGYLYHPSNYYYSQFAGTVNPTAEQQQGRASMGTWDQHALMMHNMAYGAYQHPQYMVASGRNMSMYNSPQAGSGLQTPASRLPAAAEAHVSTTPNGVNADELSRQCLFNSAAESQALSLVGEVEVSLAAKWSASDRMAANTHGPVKVVLLQKKLWKQFLTLTNEMIVSKLGRRMFPLIRVEVSGLDPDGLYVMALQFLPLVLKRWKWDTDSLQWKQSDSMARDLSEPVFVQDEERLGSDWISGDICFEKLKLSKRPVSASHVILNTFYKYTPHMCILRRMNDDRLIPVKVEPLSDTEFMATSVYQNKKIKKLKIANNPFAKAFIKNEQSDNEQKHPSNNESCQNDDIIEDIVDTKPERPSKRTRHTIDGREKSVLSNKPAALVDGNNSMKCDDSMTAVDGSNTRRRSSRLNSGNTTASPVKNDSTCETNTKNDDSDDVEFVSQSPGDSGLIRIDQSDVQKIVQKIHILVVHADTKTHELFRRLSVERGLYVTVCEGVQDMWQIFRKDGSNIDIVFADMDLSRSDRIFLLSQVRMLPRSCSMTLIMLAYQNNHDDAIEMVGLGADDCLLKPLYYAPLYKRIMGYVERNSMYHKIVDLEKSVEIKGEAHERMNLLATRLLERREAKTKQCQ